MVLDRELIPLLRAILSSKDLFKGSPMSIVVGVIDD